MLAGAYPNEGNADLTFSSRQLDISAEGIVTIDCSGRPGLTLERGDYKLRGLRWRACDGALTIRQASASLDNCVISACQASGSRASAIQAFDSSLVLQNCSLDHNKGSVHGVQHAARHTPHATRRTPHAALRTPHAARRPIRRNLLSSCKGKYIGATLSSCASRRCGAARGLEHGDAPHDPPRQRGPQRRGPPRPPTTPPHHASPPRLPTTPRPTRPLPRPSLCNLCTSPCMHPGCTAMHPGSADY